GLSRAQYDTWFKDTQVISEEDDVYLIGVPNAFAREWLESKFRAQVRTALQHLLGRTVDVRFVTSSGAPAGGARTSAAPGMTSAPLSVAERPGHSYNPLFVYGGSGLGKTHLMHAIGHAVIARHPKKRVAYATSEKFTNEFINSIRAQKGEEFRERYRRIDVLLIDDIQFIAGKEGTQEEFFHTFNAIHEEGKQIVMSSDRPPKAITQLDDRLRAR